MTNPKSESGTTDVQTSHSGILSPLAVNLRQAARLLGISPRKLHDLAVGGHVPTIRVGTRRLYVVTDLQSWLASQPKGGEK